MSKVVGLILMGWGVAIIALKVATTICLVGKPGTSLASTLDCSLFYGVLACVFGLLAFTKHKGKTSDEHD